MSDTYLDPEAYDRWLCDEPTEPESREEDDDYDPHDADEDCE